ncbi:MAG: hypothetical protein STHCBS139747_000846 [Sporothrix thermara]
MITSPSRLSALMAALASFSAVGVTPAAAAKDSRTFAVLRFHGDGPLVVGRSDPIVNPGQPAAHVHVVQGGNAFSNSATGETMLESTCSTANVAGDKSAYWMPQLYFRDNETAMLEAVPLFYMNVYYFFEATNDDITAFPVGLQMVSGDASLRTAPATGNNVLDPSQGTIQPAQFTCPRSSYDPPSYPAGSDGSTAGIQDTGNLGAGAGFPFAECDGYASPLRADLHFPSCYDPSQPLTAYKTNTVFPTDAGDGKADCPPGWIHTPHIFFEMYWNTPLFVDRWDPAAADSQPFVLSNGDATGFTLHGDFMAGWDTDVLQHIIDTCDAGDAGMDQCAGVETVMTGNCHVDNPTPEDVLGPMSVLPGNNPLFGWPLGTGAAAPAAPETPATTTAGKTTAAATTAVTTSSTTSSKASSTKASSSSKASTTKAADAAASSSAAADASSAAAPSAAAPSSPLAASDADAKTAASSPAPAAVASSSATAALASSKAAAVSGTVAPVADAAAVASSSTTSASTSASASTPAGAGSAAAVSAAAVSAAPAAAMSPSSAAAMPPPPAEAAPTPAADEAAGAGCRAPTDITTSTITIPVTVYSTSTSTIYVTASSSTAPSPSAPVVAKRELHLHRHAHAGRR